MNRSLSIIVACVALTAAVSLAGVVGLEGSAARDLNSGNDFNGSITDSYTLVEASDSVFVAALYHYDKSLSATFGGTAMAKVASATSSVNSSLIVDIFAIDLGAASAGSKDIVITSSGKTKGSAAFYQLSNTSLDDDVSNAWAAKPNDGFILSGMSDGGLVIDLQVDGTPNVGSADGNPDSTFTISGAPGNRGFKSSNYDNVAAGDVTVGYGVNAGSGAAATVAVGLQPVPEPATLSLLGLGAVGLLRRRRR